MARNSEKNYGRLNRLWLEKREVKTEKRPKLSALKTSDEISYWLPSIKSELDFVLKQSEVPCYSEQKISECRKKIFYLEAEYKAFVRKLHKVSGTLKSTPWTARPYEKRNLGSTKNGPILHPVENNMGSQSINFLETPVLQHDHLYDRENFGEELNSLLGNCVANDEKPLEFQHLSAKQTGIPPLVEMIPKAPLLQDGHSTSKNALGLDYSSSSEDDV